MFFPLDSTRWHKYPYGTERSADTWFATTGLLLYWLLSQPIFAEKAAVGVIATIPITKHPKDALEIHLTTRLRA
jgi:hypothetical protein